MCLGGPEREGSSSAVSRVLESMGVANPGASAQLSPFPAASYPVKCGADVDGNAATPGEETVETTCRNHDEIKTVFFERFIRMF